MEIAARYVYVNQLGSTTHERNHLIVKLVCEVIAKGGILRSKKKHRESY